MTPVDGHIIYGALADTVTVISGNADTGNNISEEEVTKALEFCANAWNPTIDKERDSVMEKLAACGPQSTKSPMIGAALQTYNGKVAAIFPLTLTLISTD